MRVRMTYLVYRIQYAYHLMTPLCLVGVYILCVIVCTVGLSFDSFEGGDAVLMYSIVMDDPAGYIYRHSLSSMHSIDVL